MHQTDPTDLFRWIRCSLSDGIWILDDTGATVFANDQMAEILGETPHAMTGLTLADVLDTTGTPEVLARLEDPERSAVGDDNLECHLVHKDGTRIRALVSRTPLLDDDDVRRGWLHRVTVLTNPDLLLDSHTSDVHNPISFGLVLVAEDNAVNRLVAGGVLENLGYQVEFAHDGLEAVDAMTRSRDRFVAVLMDCQMPRLDGFEATRVIRKMEPSGAHMPVIAMTASVLPGDRERCFEAGMDDFLTKPIDVVLLESTLARWVRGEASTTVGGASHAKPQEVVSEEDPTGLLDLDRIRMLHGLKPGDQSFFEKFSETFVARVAGDVAAIEATIRDGDHPRLAMAAHSLKGSAQNLGAAEVGRACQALEDAGDRHDITDAPGLLLELRRQVDLTVLALREQPA